MKSLADRVIYVIGTGAKKITQLPRIVDEFSEQGATVFTMASEMGLEIYNAASSGLLDTRCTYVPGYSNAGESIPLEDLVLIAPCTFNTLNKLAAGIADTYPLTIAQTAIGAKRNVVIAPAMNHSLWHHPITEESIKKLQSWGCRVVWPEISLDHVTMAPTGKIADTVFHLLARTRYESIQMSLNEKYSRAIETHYLQIKGIGEKMTEAGLTNGAGGCISVKAEGGILVTSSGALVGDLREEELSLIVRAEGEKIFWMGHKKPSSESPLLSELYQLVPDSAAIIHGHCKKITYNPTMKPYLSPDYVRYGVFGEGESIVPSLVANNGFVILKLHGEISVSNSLDGAYQTLKQKLEEAHGK